jgi:beta-lactamase class A
MRTVMLMVGILAAATPQAQKLTDLTPRILGKLQSVPGRFAVGVYDLQRNESLYINPDTLFHAASTMKTPVMIEVYKQAREGKFRLDDKLQVKNEFHSIVDGSTFALDAGDDSDSIMYKRLGSRMTIRELVVHMITVSSNLATNLLIELVDAKRVMETMRSLGIDDLKVLRGVEDGKAFRQGLNNVVTARDLVTVFRSLESNKIVDREACREMTKILSDQKFKDIIPALLPPGVRVAHKTGSITGVEHDSGIVYLPNGKSYVVVLLSKNVTDAKAAKRTMAEVSRLLYDFFSKGN